MSETAENIELDSLFGVLAHAKRRAMLQDLSYRPATISQLARDHNFSLPAIHKHLRLLERAGLIVRRKSGRTNFIALQPDKLLMLQQWILQFHTQWSSPHQTLENYISAMTAP